MGSKRKIRNLTKNTVLFMISSLGTKMISFLLTPLYTYVFSTSEYGTADLMVTIVQLLIPVLTLNIQEAILRYGLDKEYDSVIVIQNGFKVIGWSSLFLGIAEALILWGYPASIRCNYLLFLYFSYLSGSLYNALSAYLKVTGKVKKIAIAGIIYAAVTCTLSVILLVVLKWGVNGYMIASVAGVFVADMGMLIGEKIPWKLCCAGNVCDKKVLRSMLAYSVPLIAGTVGWWLNNASDRFVLFLFCGTAMEGLYAAAYKLPAVLAVLQDIFYNAWSVSAIEEFDKADSDGFIGNVYSVYSMISVLVCSFIMISNVFLVSALYSENFFDSWKYIPILLTGTVFSGLSRFLGCFYLAAKRTKAAAMTNIFGALFNLGFNFILIPIIGAYGAAIATLLGYVSLWLIRMYNIRSIIVIRVNWRSEGICYALLLAQSALAAICENFVFQLPFLMGIILVYFYFLRKRIVAFRKLAERRKSI